MKQRMYQNTMTPENQHLAVAQRELAMAILNATGCETVMRMQYGERLNDEYIHNIYHQILAPQSAECPITINGISGGVLGA